MPCCAMLAYMVERAGRCCKGKESGPFVGIAGVGSSGSGVYMLPS